MDHDNVFPEYGEDMEKHLTNDDIQYLDRVYTDFFNYYLNNQKSFPVISLGKKDPRERMILYELKILFLACKLCKQKTQYWSSKYHDITNKIRSFIQSENILSGNPNAHYSKADPKYKLEQKLDPNVSAQERRRLIKMNEQHNERKNIVENDMSKLFNKPTYTYKNIRNRLNEKFEKE
jgi:hypothetical protein